MKRLFQIVGLVLLVLWVPITSHCAWENVPGLEFFQCPTDAPQNSDCKDDGCAQLESANYKTPDAQADVVPFALLFSAEILTLEFSADDRPHAVVTTPPEIPSAWQFHFRTALPPRAPSFVS